MKLKLDLFGGRGASSSNKVYTAKDIKTLRSNITGIKGYELNGIYLLKHYGQGVRGNDYGWIINKKENNSLSLYTDYSKAIDNGTAINVANYKEGKIKLIELANKKSRR